MKCPMHYQVTGYVQDKQVIDFFDCVNERCAWWDKDKCAILTIAQQLQKQIKVSVAK